MKNSRPVLVVLLCLLAVQSFAQTARNKELPNIVLMMSDDQGWGETGYNGHPYLKTPVLDEMAATGLRFDRFYAASPVCTPTRASVMTGRHANRSGAFSWNWSIRPEEVTLSQALKDAGYRTAHFGKWHIGAIKKGSPLNPKALGFDEYLSHDNFFEMDPKLSRNGEEPVVFKGEGSKVVIDEALKFVRKVHGEDKPFFIVIWFGSPHCPYSGLDEDVALYEKLGPAVSRRFSEITAMDRAIGSFRDELDRLKIRDNTLLWFNSDNGISHQDIPAKEKKYLWNGELKGKKGNLYEGGMLVPGLIEWPGVIQSPKRTSMACVTSDIMPTLLDLLDIKHPTPERPMDGKSLKKLILGQKDIKRKLPIGGWKYASNKEKNNKPWIEDQSLCEMITMTTRQIAAKNKSKDYKPDSFLNYRHPVAGNAPFVGDSTWIDDRYKLIVLNNGKRAELYDLTEDPKELNNIASQHPEIVKKMRKELENWQISVENSLTGADYTKQIK